MQTVVELPLESPFELSVIQIPRMKFEVVGMHGDRWTFEFDDHFHGFALGASGEMEQGMLIKAQLGEDTCEPRVGVIGHDPILSGVAVACARAGFGTGEGFLKFHFQLSDLSSRLFVSQGFDRVELRGFDGRQHAAHDPHETKNAGGPDQGNGIDGEVDVAFVGALLKCAPESE